MLCPPQLSIDVTASVPIRITKMICQEAWIEYTTLTVTLIVDVFVIEYWLNFIDMSFMGYLRQIFVESFAVKANMRQTVQICCARGKGSIAAYIGP